ncbi:serine aminopeptidase domain-containing protein [Streptomyces sp. NPDC085900]|uniref:serine aminopeptidase domain-containing protein n=1 Tax=Streptomyces sp. NPDC085900 TaxID=3365737 RepID=UPI0037D875E2
MLRAARVPKTRNPMFTFHSEDGVQIHVHEWQPDTPPRAVVQIAHGVGEHAGRYAPLAAALTTQGYAVYADDHRGHGLSRHAEPGHLGDDGWNRLVSDLVTLSEAIREQHPGLPLVLLTARTTPSCKSTGRAAIPSKHAPTGSSQSTAAAAAASVSRKSPSIPVARHHTAPTPPPTARATWAKVPRQPLPLTCVPSASQLRRPLARRGLPRRLAPAMG